jgi:hypothetical protein
MAISGDQPVANMLEFEVGLEEVKQIDTPYP